MRYLVMMANDSWHDLIVDKVIPVEDHGILELHNVWIADFFDNEKCQLVRKLADVIYIPIVHVARWYQIPDDRVIEVGSNN